MSDIFLDPEILADLRSIEADKNYAVKCGHELMSNDLAYWRQTGEIGWHLTDKGCAALLKAEGTSA